MRVESWQLDRVRAGSKSDTKVELKSEQETGRLKSRVYEDTLKSKTLSSIKDIELLHKLGRGGFGSVYKGLLGGKAVAVKILHTTTKNEEAKRESFTAELNILHLDHPNVIAGLAAFTPEGDESGALIMAYVGDRNLQHIIDDPNEVISVSRRMKYSYQLAQALKYVHSKFIVHLDVKPANILVPSDDCIKLADFGCCQVMEENTGVVSPHTRSQLTGTVAYRAPELLKGKNPCPKADIYALGVTFWQLLTRIEPYGKEDPHVVIFSVVAFKKRPPVQPLEEVTSALERQYQETFVKCWDADPEARPNAHTLKETLGKLIPSSRSRLCGM